MATVTQIQQQVTALGVRVAAEIDKLRTEMGSLTGVTPEWTAIIGKPSTFPPSAHTQDVSTITGFDPAVDARIALAGVGGAPDWSTITNKPATFAPSAHTHVAADITNFNAAVDTRIALAGAGDGNVVGPSGGVADGEIAVYNGTSGAALKASGITPTANGIALIESTYAGMRALLDLEIGTDVQAQNAKLTALAGQTWAADQITYQTGVGSLGVLPVSTYGKSLLNSAGSNALRNELGLRESIIVAVGDETTPLTAGNNKVTFRMPYALQGVEVRASLTTASSSGLVTVDVNENGVSILSTKVTIDATEKTSTTAATAPVMSDAILGDDNEITIDIDTAGTGATGLKVTFIGTRP